MLQLRDVEILQQNVVPYHVSDFRERQVAVCRHHGVQYSVRGNQKRERLAAFDLIDHSRRAEQLLKSAETRIGCHNLCNVLRPCCRSSAQQENCHHRELHPRTPHGGCPHIHETSFSGPLALDPFFSTPARRKQEITKTSWEQERR